MFAQKVTVKDDCGVAIYLDLLAFNEVPAEVIKEKIDGIIECFYSDCRIKGLEYPVVVTTQDNVEKIYDIALEIANMAQLQPHNEGDYTNKIYSLMRELSKYKVIAIQFNHRSDII